MVPDLIFNTSVLTQGEGREGRRKESEKEKGKDGG